MTTHAWHIAAGLSGASAIALGAWGAHGFKPKSPTYKDVFQTASQYHLLHSLLLAIAPISRRPRLVSSYPGPHLGVFLSLYV